MTTRPFTILILSFIIFAVYPTAAFSAATNPLIAAIDVPSTATVSYKVNSNNQSEKDFDELKTKVNTILQNKIQKSFYDKIFHPDSTLPIPMDQKSLKR